MATATTATETDSAPVSGYRTVADLLDHLGGVSPARVRFQPWPGTATVDDVIAIHDVENRLCELVDGVLVEKVMGFDESIYAVLLSAAIVDYLKTHDLGKVVGADGLMRIFPDLVRIPDAAFISWRRFPKGKRRRGEIPLVVPDLVVEVLSKGNTPKEMVANSMSIFKPACASSGTSIPGGKPLASIRAATARRCSAKTKCSTAEVSCRAFPSHFANGLPTHAEARHAERQRELTLRKATS